MDTAIVFLEGLPVDVLRQILFDEGNDPVVLFGSLVKAAPAAIRADFVAKLRHAQDTEGVWRRFVHVCFPALGRFRTQLPRDMQTCGPLGTTDNQRWRWFAARLLCALDTLHLAVVYKHEGDNKLHSFAASLSFADWADVRKHLSTTPFLTCRQYLAHWHTKRKSAPYTADDEDLLAREQYPRDAQLPVRFVDTAHLRLTIAVRDKGRWCRNFPGFDLIDAVDVRRTKDLITAETESMTLLGCRVQTVSSYDQFEHAGAASTDDTYVAGKAIEAFDSATGMLTVIEMHRRVRTYLLDHEEVDMFEVETQALLCEEFVNSLLRADVDPVDIVFDPFVHLQRTRMTEEIMSPLRRKPLSISSCGRAARSSAMYARAQPAKHLRVTLEYAPALAGGNAGEYAHESDPWLELYVTHGAGAHKSTLVSSAALRAAFKDGSAQLTVDVPFAPERAAHHRRSEARGWTLPNAAPLLPLAPPHELPWVPANTALGISVQVHTATEPGLECASYAGNTLFLLAELASLAAEQPTDAHPLIQNTGDEPLIKGALRIIAAHVVRAGSDAPEPIGAHARLFAEGASHAVFHETDIVPGAAEHASRAVALLSHHLNHSLDVFFGSARFARALLIVLRTAEGSA